jgi:hypothetical protein
MVNVVSKIPHQSVVKEVVCRNCGATLSYVPREVKSRIIRDYSGSSEDYRHIDCPNCSKEVGVK